MTEREAMERVIALNAQMRHAQHQLVVPYYPDIEAYGKMILKGFVEQDENMAIGGLQMLFLYAYLCGCKDANEGRP